jgi:hypothetical protein
MHSSMAGHAIPAAAASRLRLCLPLRPPQPVQRRWLRSIRPWSPPPPHQYLPTADPFHLVSAARPATRRHDDDAFVARIASGFRQIAASEQGICRRKQPYTRTLYKVLVIVDELGTIFPVLLTRMTQLGVAAGYINRGGGPYSCSTRYRCVPSRPLPLG